MNHNIYYVKLYLNNYDRKISIILLSLVVISTLYIVYIIYNPVSPLETVQMMIQQFQLLIADRLKKID